ncbi:hypothetical protein F1654_00760 [Alkalicaulis satelles]|uniref:Uncharacterized protein n=1 Tax=Alkalicaulis satelles TaxID=2609175 RepID=A0A5M6ZIC6_9PROT|nr:hypothetical protein [Alkalicaulis satelles]KAA5804573.1 hypothetical protein F1654_00760 [Alkalicaulis satelles]
MTSEVMIMNRQAVVLAADSAVTYGGGPDPVVTLEAEKILRLGPNMAVMVYSRGDVLGRSWSHIAHAFVKQHDNAEYASVDDCARAFFSFIDHNRRLFPEDEEMEEFEHLMRAAFLTVLSHAKAMRRYPAGGYDNDAAAFEAALDLYREHLIHDEAGAERQSLEVFAEFDRTRFYERYAAMLDGLIEEALGAFGMQAEMRDKLFDFAYMIATRPAFLEPYAGLVFAGFGEGDVFPVYAHYYASILVDGVMKRAHDETMRVGVEDGPNAYLRTFAQAEMTHAFLRGIHPLMFDVMLSLNWITNESAAEAALKQAGVPDEQAEPAMDALREGPLPSLTTEFARAVQEISQEEFINPFVQVVAASGKRQLAETAKSLVELNILKSALHMTQTGVGGDVDVAMISRTGGLEWYALKS